MLIKAGFLRWLAVVSWMAVIFTLSSVPGSKIPGIVPDYVVHSGEYAILSFLLGRALVQTFDLSFCLPATILLCAAYAVSDELHQIFVPLRTASVYDLAVDSAAATAVALAVFFWSTRQARK